MKISLISACSDLGVHIDGSNLGPIELSKHLNLKNYIIEKDNIKKSKDPYDLRKNEVYINKFTKKIFDTTLNILENNEFPLLLGGDHSCVIGSALASQKKFKDIGVIWIDAHGDYNTFETTKSGNIHGLPFAAITGYKCEDLTNFITDNYINPKKCVIVGARSIDPWEIGNIKDAGVTVFTTLDLNNLGVKEIMNKAFAIAGNNIHISYDLDVIDPKIAPGVSVPEENGITDIQAYEIMDELIKNKDLIRSMDLVELNPTLDIDNKTKNIALKLLNMFIEKK